MDVLRIRLKQRRIINQLLLAITLNIIIATGLLKSFHLKDLIIIHAFIYPDSNLGINSSAIDKDIKELLDPASHNNVKVMIGLGPGDETSKYYSKIASDSAKTEGFAKLLLSFCTLHGYCGVDLDWEIPKPCESFIYERFVRIVNKELKTKSLFFSITVPGQYYKTSYLKYRNLANTK